ncbi:hypothetical protein ACFQNJ_12035 [Hydrogenophaga bisanensis]|uniref:Uncharacterized protein n=1 Tax=Hydrogenophaga bisanensis TaxID=439611 RepID=A0ABW2RAZ1_9BURK
MSAWRQRPTLARRTGTEHFSPDVGMTLLLLEALGAFLLLIFIVWWTMFSGRKNGELRDEVHDRTADEKDPGEPPTPRS